MTWPVFITTGSPDGQDSIRGLVAAAVITFWLRHREASQIIVLDAGADVRLWTTLRTWGYGAHPALDIVRLPPDDSQRRRHIESQRYARDLGAPYYVATDDDIMPRPEFSVAMAVALAERDPHYAMVTALLSSCTLPHTIEDAPSSMESAPVAEGGAGGGLRVWRTAAAIDYPPPDPSAPRAYDRVLATAIRAAGHQVGYYTSVAPRSLRVAHFPGGAYSTVWPDLAVPAAFPRDTHAESGCD
ncbi:MAG: hypothetical protein Q8O71_01615 [bacterium]|nr:hypothetical protein [bacterium]